MKKTPTLLLALFASGAMAQVTCQNIGTMTFCSDGTNYNHIGSQTFGSDGSSANRIGNQTFINPAPPPPVFQPPVFQVPQYQTQPIQPPAGMLRPQQCGFNSLGRYVCF